MWQWLGIHMSSPLQPLAMARRQCTLHLPVPMPMPRACHQHARQHSACSPCKHSVGCAKRSKLRKTAQPCLQIHCCQAHACGTNALPASAMSRRASRAFRFLLPKNRCLSVLLLFWMAQAMWPYLSLLAVLCWPSISSSFTANHTCRHDQPHVDAMQAL